MAAIAANRWTPLLATGTGVAVLALLGASSFAIAIAPALLLLAHLVVGRFPGERLIESLARRGRGTAAPHSAQWRQRRPSAPRVYGPRGGTLLAVGLSGRAPPLG